MTVPDDTRLDSGASTSQLPPSVVARCEGCELASEVDALGASAGDLVAECGDCGSPVYVVGVVDRDVFLTVLGIGWDACAALMAAVVAGEQLDELTGDVAAVLEGGA